jgi:hypothetical protein
MGYAAAHALDLAGEKGTSVHDIDTGTLRSRLGANLGTTEPAGGH